jgi:hypothetical protein
LLLLSPIFVHTKKFTFWTWSLKKYIKYSQHLNTGCWILEHSMNQTTFLSCIQMVQIWNSGFISNKWPENRTICQVFRSWETKWLPDVQFELKWAIRLGIWIVLFSDVDCIGKSLIRHARPSNKSLNGHLVLSVKRNCFTFYTLFNASKHSNSHIYILMGSNNYNYIDRFMNPKCSKLHSVL